VIGIDVLTSVAPFGGLISRATGDVVKLLSE
jgi:hypothetical protein